MARSWTKINTCLGATGDESPFVRMARGLQTAILNNARARSSVLLDTLNTILSDLYDHFDAMIDERLNDFSEKSVRDAMKLHMHYATKEFDLIKEDLVQMKGTYGQ